MFAKTKQKNLTFEDIEPEIAKRTGQITSNPELLRIRQQLEFFEKKLKEVSEKHYASCGSQASLNNKPVILPDAEHDAKSIIAGRNVDELQGPRLEEAQYDYVRQMRALKRAKEILIEEQRRLWFEAIKNGCEKIKPQMTVVIENVVSAMENLADAIEMEAKFFDYLNRLGYDERGRPTGWLVNPIEGIYLNGGLANLPSIRYHIQTRIKTFDLDRKKRDS